MWLTFDLGSGFNLPVMSSSPTNPSPQNPKNPKYNKQKIQMIWTLGSKICKNADRGDLFKRKENKKHKGRNK